MLSLKENTTNLEKILAIYFITCELNFKIRTALSQVKGPQNVLYEWPEFYRHITKD